MRYLIVRLSILFYRILDNNGQWRENSCKDVLFYEEFGVYVVNIIFVEFSRLNFGDAYNNN